MSEMDESIMNTSYRAGTTVTNTDIVSSQAKDNQNPGGFTDEANLYANNQRQQIKKRESAEELDKKEKHLRRQEDKKERHMKLFQGISIGNETKKALND